MLAMRGQRAMQLRFIFEWLFLLLRFFHSLIKTDFALFGFGISLDKIYFLGREIIINICIFNLFLTHSFILYYYQLK